MSTSMNTEQATGQPTPAEYIERFTELVGAAGEAAEAWRDAKSSVEQFRFAPPDLEGDGLLGHIIQVRRGLDDIQAHRDVQVIVEDLRKTFDYRINELQVAGCFSWHAPSFCWSSFADRLDVFRRPYRGNNEASEYWRVARENVLREFPEGMRLLEYFKRLEVRLPSCGIVFDQVIDSSREMDARKRLVENLPRGLISLGQVISLTKGERGPQDYEEEREKKSRDEAARKRQQKEEQERKELLAKIQGFSSEEKTALRKALEV